MLPYVLWAAWPWLASGARLWPAEEGRAPRRTMQYNCSGGAQLLARAHACMHACNPLRSAGASRWQSASTTAFCAHCDPGSTRSQHPPAVQPPLTPAPARGKSGQGQGSLSRFARFDLRSTCACATRGQRRSMPRSLCRSLPPGSSRKRSQTTRSPCSRAQPTARCWPPTPATPRQGTRTLAGRPPKMISRPARRWRGTSTLISCRS